MGGGDLLHVAIADHPRNNFHQDGGPHRGEQAAYSSRLQGHYHCTGYIFGWQANETTTPIHWNVATPSSTHSLANPN
jgi:hypothetical protein